VTLENFRLRFYLSLLHLKSDSRNSTLGFVRLKASCSVFQCSCNEQAFSPKPWK